VHFSCGIACNYLNRVDAALAHFDTDIKASPGAQTNFYNFTHQAGAHIRAAQWQDAIIKLDNALALHPDFPLALIFKAIVCSYAGQAEQAHNLVLHTRQVELAGTLAVWELNFKRHLVACPNLDLHIEHLHRLWSATESAV
jgi:tetratricopeptide (TPR) repeat protein